VLKTLAFNKGQASATVSWQATATNVLGGLVGVHLGLAPGRVLWTAFATDLGVVLQSRWPVLLSGVLVGGTLAALALALTAAVRRGH